MSKHVCSTVYEFAELFAKMRESADPAWKLIARVFDAHVSVGQLYIPETFYGKIYKWFGRVDDKSEEDAVLRVEEQKIVRIFNKWTFRQTMFNPLRALRPNNIGAERALSSDELEEIPSLCDFCSPISYTAVDTWGRIERDTCLTSSNVAKYDGYHGLIIFKDHSPLKYSKEKLDDILTTCEEWFSCAHNENRNAIYPMFSWNCKARAGASQHHGHCHMLLAEKFHYGNWEYYRHCAGNYARAHPGSNYFSDLIAAQSQLGLVKSVGNAHILVNLTPYMGYDMEVISWNYDQDFFDALDIAISTLLQRFKSLTFNIGIHYPPLDAGRMRRPIKPEHFAVTTAAVDAPMPFIAYLVDRGEPSCGRTTSDVCSMKLWGSSVVAQDPFQVAAVLRVPTILWK